MDLFQKKGLSLPLILLLCLWGLVSPSYAWAVQAHGGAEGLVSHQIGHILFFIGIVGLLVGQQYKQLVGPGWREFKLFLYLIIFWNILTFSGHWMHELVNMDKFLQDNGQTVAFRATTTFDFLFYLTRLDHLLLVPAFFSLLMAVQRWEKGS